MATALRAVSVEELSEENPVDEVDQVDEGVDESEESTAVGSESESSEYFDSDDSQVADGEVGPANDELVESPATASSNDLSLLQRWANDVQEKQRGRAAYLQEIDRAKRELKSAKTELEEYDAELFDFISRGPYQPTLFDGLNDDQPKVVEKPADSISSTVTLDTPIAQAGLDKDLLAAVETLREDIPVETLRDLELFLDSQPTEKRLVYLNVGHESALRVAIAAAKVTESVEMKTSADESWRSEPISALGLPGKLPEFLADASIHTIGELADHTSSGKLLTDINGIGPGKAEVIENALEAFWEKRKG
ncbi:MAG: hypothetical protein EB060_10855 [Proteobacteria bacterium]|nr:hypothetical protein [Pseudomonadota bacterium]